MLVDSWEKKREDKYKYDRKRKIVKKVLNVYLLG